MNKKILDNVKINKSIRSSYLSSVYSVITGNKMFNGEPYLLAGMMGFSFHFIVHKELCPSSVTVYDWQHEHREMLDRTGIQTEVFQSIYNPNQNNFDFHQKQAIMRIKQSIDKGMGVVVWAPSHTPEFGVIKGYDDTDQVFYIQDYTCKEDVDPLLYDNLGKSEVSILFYQLFYDQKEVSENKMYLDSLMFAIREWEKTYHTDPNYASGRKGYEFMIRALESNNYNKFGLSYLLLNYSESKTHIYKYLKYLYEYSKEYKGLKDIVLIYETISKLYKEMEAIAPFFKQKSYETKDVLDLVKECFELEERAMEQLKKFVQLTDK